jgi:hypothetical protein
MACLCNLSTFLLYMDILDSAEEKFHNVNYFPWPWPVAALHLQHAARVKCQKRHCAVDALPKDNCGKV